MKRKILFYLLIILTLIFTLFFLKDRYDKNIITQKNNKIIKNYDIYHNLLVSYTDRINKKEEGIFEELSEKIKTSRKPIEIATYKNVLSYYYLSKGDYDMHKKLANEAIELYEKTGEAAPLILETYNYMISNSLARKDYSSALKYSYASMEILDELDFNYISESFEKNIEIILNCNLVNIFVNNNLSGSAEKYYKELTDLKEDDPLYIKNEKLIVFAKLIYADSVGNYEEALSLSIRYHELAKESNSPNIEGMRINIATALLKNNMVDEALPHILASENHYKNTTNKTAIGNVYSTYGEYYLQKGNYEKAYEKFTHSYELYKENQKYVMDQIYILEKVITTNINGNLNNDVTPYILDYIKATDLSLAEEGIANLFVTMDEINNKYYESKLLLEEKEAESLIATNKLRNKLLLYISAILILFVILTLLLFRDLNNRRKYETKLKTLIDIDFLTKCYSRNYGINLLNTMIENNTKFSIALLDIDDFKNINDTYGHIVGDEALKLLGKFLNSKLKDIGVPFRYGGEEFIIIFEGININEAYTILDDLRLQFSKLTFSSNLSCTLSIGAKAFNGESLTELLNETDKLLYEAKNTGKNKVFINE